MTKTNPNLPNLPKHPKFGARPGYEYLTCYMLGLVIQELTDEFCERFLTPNIPKHPNKPKNPNLPNPNFRQVQQMTQAARSNPECIAEGYTQESLKGYIYLSGISRGSNEELGKDFVRFLKKGNYEIWPKDHPKVREFRAFRVKWTSPTSLNTPQLPQNPQETANMLLTFCQMEGFLLKKLIDSLKEKHKKEGGLTERLYRERRKHRGY